jgi:hypothetical protein
MDIAFNAAVLDELRERSMQAILRASDPTKGYHSRHRRHWGGFGKVAVFLALALLPIVRAV